ncbi:TlpA family protein disulfide reductase [Spirosoma radiotolerans]|uniref:Thioredoxin domain-containing protein n=1 Tax=Spirosoma radiotolerans TaxID=1379870 RepID=A0A0E3ZV06_9BACT|nr:TlpA disulfide reductase family protein [Spirosoma radiotolerans]AKD54843.1 hypothetical protein SD10_07910 [Spirosoma radiotolerans]
MMKIIIVNITGFIVFSGLVACQGIKEHNNSSAKKESSVTVFSQPTSTLPFIICDFNIGKTYQRDTLMPTNGRFQKTWRLSRPAVVRLHIPNQYVRLWVAPGYRSEIKLPADPDKPYEFSGDGQLEKTYANDIQTINITDFPRVAKDSVVMPPDMFFKKATRISQRRDSVFQAYLKSYGKTISEHPDLMGFFDMEKEDNRFFLPRVLMNYVESEQVSGREKQLFFDQYIKTMSQLNEPVDSLSSENKRFFFPRLNTYYVQKQRMDGDSMRSIEAGIYAYMMETADKKFTGSTRDYLLDYYLSALTHFARTYNPEYPSITSLIERYKSSLTESGRKAMLARLAAATSVSLKRPYQMALESGQKVMLAEKLAPVTVLDIWASWCGPCLASFPAMMTLKEKYRANKSVKVIWISVDQDKSKWDKAIKKLKLDPENSLWVLEGINSAFANDLAINSIPRYLILNAKGEILQMNAPGGKNNEQKLAALIDKYSRDAGR